MPSFFMRRDVHLWRRDGLPGCGEDAFQLHLTGEPLASASASWTQGHSRHGHGKPRLLPEDL